MSALAGKLALITGSASGIGLSTARLFARQGADLILCDRSPKISELANELRSEHSELKVTGHVCDITKSDQVATLFKDIHSLNLKQKTPNVIVNSAGILGQMSPLVKMSEKDFDLVLDVNLKGTFLITQAAARALLANFKKDAFTSPTQTYATFVNLASIGGKMGAAGLSHYAMTKAGVEGFTKSIAKELGPFRIRSNAVLPYVIKTPMFTEIPVADKVDKIAKFTPLKRVGEPEEIAELILFLASDASSYVNGASVDINGGI
jgi:17beta-estradiol 17-dehydrogenase/3alpha(17beta)-hydroxysteroid dehydrogenase (NAD+)